MPSKMEKESKKKSKEAVGSVSKGRVKSTEDSSAMDVHSSLGNRNVLSILDSGDDHATALERFKTITKLGVMSPRNKIKSIDKLLEGSSGSDLKTLGNGDSIRQAVALVTASKDYLGKDDKKAKRKEGVTQLMGELLGNTQEEGVDKVKAMRAEYNDPLNTPMHSDKKTMIGNILEGKKENGVKTEKSSREAQLQKEDIETLKDMMSDDKVPEITRKILAEILTDIDSVEMRDTLGGSAAMTLKGQKVVMYGQYWADDIRLPTLAHELTHHSVANSFQNHDQYMYNYDKTDNLDVELAEIDRLRNNVLDLKGSLDSIGDDRHKRILESQLNYILMEKQGFYGDVRAMDSVPGKNMGLLKLQVRNEYDTVINQIMLYMHMWGIPIDNGFYKKASELSESAYVRREKARSNKH